MGAEGRAEGDQKGIPWGESGPSGYKPAFRLGNDRDAELIARSSGRPVEEFLSGREEEPEGKTEDSPLRVQSPPVKLDEIVEGGLYVPGGLDSPPPAIGPSDFVEPGGTENEAG